MLGLLHYIENPDILLDVISVAALILWMIINVVGHSGPGVICMHMYMFIYLMHIYICIYLYVYEYNDYMSIYTNIQNKQSKQHIEICI